MREKLIELLRCVQYLGGLEEKIADHLIANGVTSEKWIPVTERLPDEGRHVLAWSEVGDVYETAFWNGVRWIVTWEHDEFVGVTHWMPLPEPPREE